jgi:hypothetical protein
MYGDVVNWFLFGFGVGNLGRACARSSGVGGVYM